MDDEIKTSEQIKSHNIENSEDKSRQPQYLSKKSKSNRQIALDISNMRIFSLVIWGTILITLSLTSMISVSLLLNNRAIYFNGNNAIVITMTVFATLGLLIIAWLLFYMLTLKTLSLIHNLKEYRIDVYTKLLRFSKLCTYCIVLSWIFLLFTAMFAYISQYVRF